MSAPRIPESVYVHDNTETQLHESSSHHAHQAAELSLEKLVYAVRLRAGRIKKKGLSSMWPVIGPPILVLAPATGARPVAALISDNQC